METLLRAHQNSEARTAALEARNAALEERLAEFINRPVTDTTDHETTEADALAEPDHIMIGVSEPSIPVTKELRLKNSQKSIF